MAKRLTKTRLTGIAVAAMLGIAAMTAPVQAETLRMAWAQDATGLDPHKQTAFPSLRLLELVYEPLVRLDPQLQIVPAIAESWKYSPDGQMLTFKIDADARFQNGDPVTSADVKASFERILDEETGAVARANFLSIEGIEAPDANTVVFNLNQPDAPMLTAMTDINAAVLPAGEIAAGSIGTTTIGSGPFSLENWDPNSKATLVANKDWAGGTPGVDGIDISVFPDESAILAAMRTKQIDFALMNDPLIATLVPREAGLQLNREPVLSYHVLQLNPSRSPFTELGVRQAISCAIDRQQILDTASLGEGRVTGPLTIPAFASDPNSLFCYTRDVEKAKTLLADAGFADGFSTTVIAATGEPPTAASEAQVIQSQLAEVGIQVEIEMMELNVYIDRWLKADFDMAVALNGGRADPFTMYNRYWTKAGNLQKVSNYIDDTLDSLMMKGRAETDPAARKETFAAFEKHLAEMSPWIWLYNSYNYTAQQDNVKGFKPTPTGSLFSLSEVTVE